MKRVLIALLAVILVLSVTACSGDGDVKSRTSADSGTSIDTPDATEPAVTTASSIAKPGENMKLSKYDFQFEKAETYDEIEFNEYYSDTPEEGNVYLVCFFTVENISGEDDYVNPLYLDGYIDDVQTTESFLIGDVDGYASLGGDLAAGKKMQGFIAYEVPENWQKVEFTYTDGFLDDADKYQFEVTPDTIG